MPKESRFGYQKRTPEQFRATLNRRGGGFDSFIKREFKRYKMRDGKNVVRFIQPTWEDAEHFAYEIHLNYDVGPDKQSYLSLSRMGKGADPLDEARREASRKGDAELAKALLPGMRWVAWVIDKFDADSEAEGPQIFDFPKKLNDAICTASKDEDTGEIVWVDDPVEGADVRFYKEGQGKTGTNYPGEKVKVLKPGPLSADAADIDEWIKFAKAHPIPECLQFYDYDHISSVFNGAAKPKDEDETDHLTKSPNNARRLREAVAAADAGKFEEEKPWEDEDDEEEVKAPPPKAKKAADTDNNTGSIRDRLRRRREELQEEED